MVGSVRNSKLEISTCWIGMSPCYNFSNRIRIFTFLIDLWEPKWRQCTASYLFPGLHERIDSLPGILVFSKPGTWQGHWPWDTHGSGHSKHPIHAILIWRGLQECLQHSAGRLVPSNKPRMRYFTGYRVICPLSPQFSYGLTKCKRTYMVCSPLYCCPYSKLTSR